MPDDFDSIVAERFKVLDHVSVPDTWSRVQLKVVDEASIEFADEDATMIDLDTVGATRERATWPKRVLAGLLAAAAVIAIVAVGVVVVRDEDTSVPADEPSTTEPTATVPADDPSTTEPTASTITNGVVATATAENGWVAFVEGGPDTDIWLVRDGSPARRIAGSEGDAVAQACPAFSPDGRQLAYGQLTRTDDGGYQDAGLVIAELTADGSISDSATIALDDPEQLATVQPSSTGGAEIPGGPRPPCAIWSADGRWLAFGAGTYDPHHHYPAVVDAAWVADTESGELHRVPDVTEVTDLEWAPDAAELYVASEDVVKVFSLATNETRQLDWSTPPDNAPVLDGTWRVDFIGVSPDGTHMAIQVIRKNAPELVDGASRFLRVADVVGTGEAKRLVDRGVVSADYDELHGDGPVWSPDGRQIAHHRACDSCSEQSEIVLVTLNDNGASNSDDPPALDTTQEVIPAPQTSAEDGTTLVWWPFYVVWSPDGTTLLYGAWAYQNDSEVQGVLAVPVDGGTPHVIQLTDLAAYTGALRLHFQSWGAEQ